MNFKKTMFALAIGSVGMMGAMSAHASNVTGALHTGDVLTISSGATTSSGGFVLGSGSFFGIDSNYNSKISLVEATAITGLDGIKIGSTADASTSNITTYFFNSSDGEHIVTGTPVTGGTAGLDMSGWKLYWGGLNIPMGVGAWQSSTTNPTLNNIMEGIGQIYGSGVSNFAWSGVYGDSYTLNYTSTVPAGAPLAESRYYLYLTGTVNAVPEATTYGMMLVGLGLVGFAVRRRKLVA